MRGLQRLRHSERERHPNGEGPAGLVTGGTHGDPQLEPPPGAPIRTAWIAGRIGLAFVDEGAGDLSTFPTGAELDAGPDRTRGCPTASPFDPHRIHSLESLEALDVELRPYIWDL